MTSRLHTHPCTDCRTPVDCDGTLERNHDGWPEVICTAYHLPHGDVAPIYCESCSTHNRREALAGG